MQPRTKAALFAVGSSALLLISQWEGRALTAYDDGVGVQTVCHGHTRGVTRGMRATPGQCEAWLREDASYAGQAVGRCTTEPITQAQYDALVSLAFNIGGHAYCTSTLVKKLNAGDCLGAADQFPRWNKAGGQVLRGLVKRRADERARFVADCPIVRPPAAMPAAGPAMSGGGQGDA